MPRLIQRSRLEAGSDSRVPPGCTGPCCMSRDLIPGLAQPLRELVAQAAEAAIRHEEDDVTATGLRGERAGNRVCVSHRPRRSAARHQILGELIGREQFGLPHRIGGLVEDAADDHLVRGGERGDVLALEDLAAAGVGARLEDRPQPTAGIA